MMKIERAWTVPAAETVDGFQAEVWAMFSGAPEGQERQLLFRFHEGEISFSPEEFVGLTRGEALALGRARDGAFVRCW